MEKRAALVTLLDRTMRAAGAQRVLYSNALASRMGLRQVDLECLYIITLTEDATPGLLATRTGLTTGAITGVIDRIQRKGYIVRERDPTDRRRIFLRPVDSKIAEIRRLTRDLIDVWVGRLEEYSEEELSFLIAFAQRHYASAVEATARLQNGDADRAAEAREAKTHAGAVDTV